MLSEEDVAVIIKSNDEIKFLGWELLRINIQSILRKHAETFSEEQELYEPVRGSIAAFRHVLKVMSLLGTEHINDWDGEF